MGTFEPGPGEEARSNLLEISEEGLSVGKDPRKMLPEFLALLFKEHSPLRALRARCLDCCCGNAAEVRKCTAVDCPSWPFRMGVNPFRKPMSDERRQAASERFARMRAAQ